MGLTWDGSTDQERGDFIREHFRGNRPLTTAQLAQLFQMTEAEIEQIVRGDYSPLSRLRRSDALQIYHQNT